MLTPAAFQLLASLQIGQVVDHAPVFFSNIQETTILERYTVMSTFRTLGLGLSLSYLLKAWG